MTPCCNEVKAIEWLRLSNEFYCYPVCSHCSDYEIASSNVKGHVPRVHVRIWPHADRKLWSPWTSGKGFSVYEPGGRRPLVRASQWRRRPPTRRHARRPWTVLRAWSPQGHCWGRTLNRTDTSEMSVFPEGVRACTIYPHGRWRAVRLQSRDQTWRWACQRGPAARWRGQSGWGIRHRRSSRWRLAVRSCPGQTPALPVSSEWDDAGCPADPAVLHRRKVYVPPQGGPRGQQTPPLGDLTRTAVGVGTLAMSPGSPMCCGSPVGGQPFAPPSRQVSVPAQAGGTSVSLAGLGPSRHPSQMTRSMPSPDHPRPPITDPGHHPAVISSCQATTLQRQRGFYQQCCHLVYFQGMFS